MNIGILVSSLGSNDKSLSLIVTLNRLCNETKVNPIVFCRKVKQYPLCPAFSILHENEAFTFNGPLIATDLESVRTLRENFCSSNKFYYLWDLDWLKRVETDYSNVAEIFLDNQLNFLTRSRYHQQLLYQVWQRPSFVIQDFNYEEFRSFIANFERF